MASSNAVSDPQGARRLGNASVGVSIAGIVVTVIIVVVVVVVTTTRAASSVSSATWCNYAYYGTCYTYRSYVGTSDYCSGFRSGSYCYYD